MFSLFKKIKTPELVKLEEPSIEPISIDEVKEFLRISGDAENETITTLIKSAREEAEKFMKSSLIKQKWRLSFSNYIEAEVDMPMGPVISIDSVKLIAKDNSESTFDAANYYLSPAKYFLFFDKIPSAKFIHINYYAGFGEVANNVPAVLKTALLNQVSYLYENRNKGGMNPASREIFNLFRRVIL